MTATLFDNFDETSEPIECAVSGKLPKWLKGTMVRNGPGIYSVGDVQYKHWFDGLALLQRFHFEDGKMWYSSKYLKSDAYTQNMAQKRIVISAFGTKSVPDPCKNIFQRFLTCFEKEPVTDNASSHFIKCGDAIYATSETPYIYRVDPNSLETLNKEDLSNYIAVNTVTSHNHYDENRNIYNIGARFGLLSKFVFVKTETERNKDGGSDFARTSTIGECTMADGFKPAYCHSFGMTPSYIIFFEGPLRINLPAVMASQITRKSCQDCFEWLDRKKTVVHIIDRHTGKELSVKIRAEPFITFHHANAFEHRGHIFLDYVRYDHLGNLEDFNMDNMRSGYAVHVDSSRRAYLYRMVIPIEIPNECNPGDDLLYGKNLEPGCRFIKQKDGSFFAVDTRISDISIEFPQYNYDRFNARPYRYVYGSAIQNDKGSTVGVVKIDTKNRETIVWSKDNEEQICAEPVFIGAADGVAEDDGVLICPIVTLHEKDDPVVVVLNASTMHEIARCTVNTRLPLGFHSVFVRSPPVV